MPWDKVKAQSRIDKLISEAPDIDVQRFNQYLPLYETQKAQMAARSEPVSPPLFSLPKGKAIVVDAVQIYISITNYDEFRLDEGQETSVSHERALRLLHLYYSAADRVIEESSVQRVDFHSGRVHAVVLEAEDGGVSRKTLGQALAFVEDFKKVAAVANQRLANSEFDAEFRVGIDVGTCVVINNGTGLEQEPLFLGGAANHAAKLADGDEPGVYVSDAVRQILGQPELGVFERFSSIPDDLIAVNAARRGTDERIVFGVRDRRSYADNVVGLWNEEIKRGEFPDFTNPTFRFFHKEPPFSDIDYAELMPSNTIRMPLVSMYADLSGYTNYIDDAVASGDIQEAVRALYVIRAEFQSVVEADFGGRKVRFIGDCIHALIAEGSSSETDCRESVASAAKCAGGLHSSFGLCKSKIGGLDELGLAVGVELGVTPVSRIGIRGDRSVRVATSVATTRSEMMQKECEHNGVKFGESALRAAPVALNDILTDGFNADMDYGDVAICLSATSERKNALGAASGLAAPFIASQAAAALPEAEKSSRLAEAVASRQSSGVGSKPWGK